MSLIILQLYCTYIFRKLNTNIKKGNISQLPRPQSTVVLLLLPSLSTDSWAADGSIHWFWDLEIRATCISMTINCILFSQVLCIMPCIWLKGFKKFVNKVLEDKRQQDLRWCSIALFFLKPNKNIESSRRYHSWRLDRFCFSSQQGMGGEAVCLHGWHVHWQKWLPQSSQDLMAWH